MLGAGPLGTILVNATARVASNLYGAHHASGTGRFNLIYQIDKEKNFECVELDAAAVKEFNKGDRLRVITVKGVTHVEKIDGGG